MSTGANEAVQTLIDARQDAEAIEYGIRSIKLCGNSYGSGMCHYAQIVAACQAATRVTGKFIATGDGRLRDLRAAKKVAAENVKAAKAAQAEFGTRRQIALALAA